MGWRLGSPVKTALFLAEELKFIPSTHIAHKLLTTFGSSALGEPILSLASMDIFTRVHIPLC